MKMKSKRSEAKNYLSSKNVHLCLLNSVKRRKKGVRRMRGQSEAKNCLSSKNVNLSLPDSVESSAQGIKIL